MYECIKAHLKQQVLHERDMCQCKEFKPLHMFVSGVEDTGKSSHKDHSYTYIQNVG